MNNSSKLRGITLLLLSSIVLALSVTFHTTEKTLTAFGIFLMIISINILAKKAVGYYFETNVRHKFWSWYRFGFRKDAHFKTSVPMAWLPLLLSMITQGFFWWLAILEFDVEARAERASRRHGLYRFTEVTEWHIAIIAMWGILANLTFAVIGYVAGFEFFTKLSVYYAFWSIIPLSSLDGSKIFFGNRFLWITLLITLGIFMAIGVVI